MIVCYSRCLYCGRRTRHEVCHRHSSDTYRPRIDEAAIVASPNPDLEWTKRWERAERRMWKRWFYREPEICPPTCQGEP